MPDDVSVQIITDATAEINDEQLRRTAMEKMRSFILLDQDILTVIHGEHNGKHTKKKHGTSSPDLRRPGLISYRKLLLF